MENGRLRVLFMIDSLAIGGAEQRLADLVKGLDKKRFHPAVATLYPGGAFEEELKPVLGQDLHCFHRAGKWDFLVLAKVVAFLLRSKIQVIQTELPVASCFGLSAAFLCRTPVKIATKRTGGPKRASFGDGLYRSTELRLARFADAVVSNSRAGRDFAISKGIPPSKVKIIRNGIDLHRFLGHKDSPPEIRERLRPNPETKVVGIGASLSPMKDHDTFLRAAALIKQAVPQTRFAILGDGPLRKPLEQMAQDLGLTSEVFFFGSRRDVAAFYDAFDVAVLASVHPEGVPAFIVEAMALGKPVVATNVGGTPEVVLHGETGFLVPLRDPQALAQAVITLLQEPEKATAMGQRAREIALVQYRIERMVREYETLYESLYWPKVRQASRR